MPGGLASPQADITRSSQLNSQSITRKGAVRLFFVANASWYEHLKEVIGDPPDHTGTVYGIDY